MKRGDTGIYTTPAVGGEQVRAFIPAPLPPKPSIDLQAIQAPLEAATLALGRLDARAALEAAWAKEQDAEVRDEIDRALAEARGG